MKTLFFTLTLAALITSAVQTFSLPVASESTPQLSKQRRDAGDDESKEEDFRVALKAR